MTVIVTVLKSGGEFQPEHVQRLHAQFHNLPSICLSDVTVPGVDTFPLRFNWPGWFSKMELFNPDLIHDDILYFDLDTQIVINPEIYLYDDHFRMLSDFYHPDKPASGMMFIPHNFKAYIWSAWIDAPLKWISECWGDQDVLEKICGREVARFDSSVKSYKLHVAGPGMPGWHPTSSEGCGTIPTGTSILCFHGKPRPWDIQLPLAMHR
ncbi:hypothetical protein GCM10022405_24070 [Gibbsiella dentisursi]|uniref:Uncharacterized protein n=1 Tax=Gibbsiella dentisursi TaxID=796890 RepID=A0ABP7LBX9_9GAMM